MKLFNKIVAISVLAFGVAGGIFATQRLNSLECGLLIKPAQPICRIQRLPSSIVWGGVFGLTASGGILWFVSSRLSVEQGKTKNCHIPNLDNFTIGQLLVLVVITGATIYPVFAKPVSTQIDPQKVAAVAKDWEGKEYRPGVKAQCATFVRQVFSQAGYKLPVTKTPLDKLPTSEGYANSLIGSDVGEIIRDRTALKAGDIVAFANTYGDYPPGTITHVGIYVGNGLMVDRPTAYSKIKVRSIDIFEFVAGVRVHVVAALRYGGSHVRSLPQQLNNKWSNIVNLEAKFSDDIEDCQKVKRFLALKEGYQKLVPAVTRGLIKNLNDVGLHAPRDFLIDFETFTASNQCWSVMLLDRVSPAFNLYLRHFGFLDGCNGIENSLLIQYPPYAKANQTGRAELAVYTLAITRMRKRFEALN